MPAGIAGNIAEVHERIGRAAKAAGRNVDSVTLIAVSKTRPAAAVRVAAAAGVMNFGENYLQEALTKMAELAELPVSWHFIGPIQSNKTRAIAERFDWVHSVDRLKVAQRLSEQRPAGQDPLNVCIQVNIGDEPSKSGVSRDALPALAAAIARLPNLRLRGLMAIPAATTDVSAQRAAFRTLREAAADLSAELGLDTLSMGMSADLEAAVAEGATMIRIGTDIFGAREPIKHNG